MNLLESTVLVLHVLTAIAVCGFVLLQHGKGADMGAAFGSGASGSLFGAAGSANFLSRSTAILATVFFLTSIGLTYLGAQHGAPQGVMEKGVMERALPAKPADVPGAAPKASDVPGRATPAPGANPASAASPNAGGGSSEVPK